MNIKLICIDMDGTLLNNNHEISDENKRVLKLASDKGIYIAITTGRLFTSARYYSNLLGINAPIISSNGAYIREKDTDKIIFESTLSLDETLEINSILNKYNFKVYFNTFNTAIASEEFPKTHAYNIFNNNCNDKDKTYFKVNSDMSIILRELSGDILKAICIDDTKENIDEILKAKKELIDLNKYEVVSSSPFNFEIMKKGTSKGNAVKNLATILGISRNEIMCIGDSENDLSMIEYAGIGIAMGNALNIVKEKATFITDTNENFGVAKAILKFI